MHSAPTTIPSNSRLKQWLLDKRSVTRLAFAMQMGKRIANALLNIIWGPLLVAAMGKPVNGLFIAFRDVFSLGGLGDLGMGGAIALRVGRYLGAERTPENDREIGKFLACARSLFLLLATGIGLATVLTSPWWLAKGFKPIPEAGSLTMVAIVGAFLIAQVMFMSYGANLNYACGNVTWPVIPSLVLLQVAFLGHWLLAMWHFALWIQFLPYVACAYTELCLVNYYVRVSHPHLANLFPLSLDRKAVSAMLGSSFWVYLCGLGNQIYLKTDSIVINAGAARGKFSDSTLTDYVYNYKFCELAVFVALTASFVTLPKITQWIHSPDPADQERVRTQMKRLNQFQTLLGCGAALAYLAGNNPFMKVWWMFNKDKVAPAEVLLQVAFALNLAVTTSSDAGIQISMRTGDRGIRLVGVAVGLTGLLNVGLSIAAMHYSFLAGIALATVLAQVVLSLYASRFLCQTMKLDWMPWVLKGCLVPLAVVSFAGWLRYIWPLDSVAHGILLVASYLLILVGGAWGLGVTPEFIRQEIQMVKKSLGK